MNMIKALSGSLSRLSLGGKNAFQPGVLSPSFSTVKDTDLMPYLHHGERPRFRDREKFRSPRRRASCILNQIQVKAIEDSKKKNPKLWQVKCRVGDAVEIQLVTQGGVDSTQLEKNRGVIQGIFRKGLDHSIMIRDIVLGEPVERTIPLHSPLIRSMKILEKNFIFKGKRKVKRAKLYYLRDLNPLLTQVSKRQ